MHRVTNKTGTIFAWIAIAILGFSLNAAGQGMIPIQGMPVPDLTEFDKIMSDFMKDNGIEAGLLGIMRNGVIVYQRGFGWKDSGHNELLRHDALMRIASCTKPFTAAAIQRLIADTHHLSLSTRAFDVDNSGGGILDYPAFPRLNDQRYALIELWHLLTHSGGWDRSQSGDHTYKEVEIADDFNDGVYPPGRVKTVRWIMGRPLDFTPGALDFPSYDPIEKYSNVGFLVLGLIVEQESGYDKKLVSYVRDKVLGPLDWVPTTELVQGKTFPAWRDPREPWYDCDKSRQNVFDPVHHPDLVDPYEYINYVIKSDGGWHHEARVGQGGMVCSTTMMLHLAENYYINVRGNFDTSYGLPTGGVRQPRSHTGNFCGTNAVVVQRSDGINFAVIFNKDGDDVKSKEGKYHKAIKKLINDEIDTPGITWPTQGVDGQWADFNEAAAGEGSFEKPWNDLSLALNEIAWEGTLNIKPGTTSWMGTIKKKVRIRAPLGTVTIGRVP